ncbi:MAG: hypothetical protein V1783_06795 [Bacteroidota bacterium]
MKWYILLLFQFFFYTSFAQESNSQRSGWLIDKTLDLAVKTDICFLLSEIQKRESSISKSVNFNKIAQQSANVEVEKIARQSNLKILDTKQIII